MMILLGMARQDISKTAARGEFPDALLLVLDEHEVLRLESHSRANGFGAQDDRM
ncbi:MAG TPA: hypothetical protein VJP02_24210 [Candidatus Sulfotelmatobacter sp.]|nr:hypothetical protein [Candidatus Sulfotelmatobacter sp.]